MEAEYLSVDWAWTDIGEGPRWQHTESFVQLGSGHGNLAFHDKQRPNRTGLREFTRAATDYSRKSYDKT